jgi:hypothetical protein
MATQSIPQKEALLGAMDVAGNSVEGAKYLVTRFEEVLIKAKVLDQSKELMRSVDDFAKYTEYKLVSHAQPWSGQSAIQSGFQNFHDNLAQDAAKNLDRLSGKERKRITFAFAIDENAQFLRGFFAEGKALEANEVQSLDILFNAWLANQGIVSKGGALYEADQKGQIKTDNAGQPIKADSNLIIKELITNKSFEAYVKKQGINITSEEHSYPNAQQDKQKHQGEAAAMENNESPGSTSPQG